MDFTNDELETALIERTAQRDALLEALEPFANKDHGHTMSTPRETCIYCAARVAIALAKGETV